MRIRTPGESAWRLDYDAVADKLTENTRSGALDASAEFTRQMLSALERAVEHFDMTSELAKILTTDVVDVEYRVERGVEVRD